MLCAASAGTLQRSQDGKTQQSSYHSRQESMPLFMVELDGQLKAFWNSSKLLIAPLTLKKIHHSPCHLILTVSTGSGNSSILLEGMLHSFNLLTEDTTEAQNGCQFPKKLTELKLEPSPPKSQAKPPINLPNIFRFL